MLPAVVAIGHEDVIENHHAQTKHDEFSDAAHVQGCIESVGFESLPFDPVLIAEGGHVFSENVPEKTQLEAFMNGIGREDHFIVVLEQQDLASAWR